MEELVAVAKQQLNRIKVMLSQAGLRYTELPDQIFGVGVAVRFNQIDYVIVTVMAGGMENQLMLTSGILNNINQDRLAALDACNSFNKSNTAYPVFLHDAADGWAILTQQTHSIELLMDVPEHLFGNVRGLPQVAAQYRADIAEKWALGGQAWGWNDEDHKSLLIRSML